MNDSDAILYPDNGEFFLETHRRLLLCTTGYGFRIDRVNDIREAFNTINTGKEYIIQAPFFQFSQFFQTEFSIFIFGQPTGLKLFLALDIDSQSKEH